jgi:uncharacterized protein (DUF697 family)/tellurite resistance protein
MQPTDYPPLVAIAMLAATADGRTDPAEQAAINAFVARLGSPDVSRLALQVTGGKLGVADLAGQLSDDEARKTAYETALAVCNADGLSGPAEQRFLEELRNALGLPATAVAELNQAARSLAPDMSISSAPTGTPTADLILQQAILTGALEVLPDRLANIAVLPLQLRLVYQIGQRHGQQLDAHQVQDLAATLGLGAAAQVLEGVVMKVLGGIGGGLLGGLFGGATRVASGAAVTFAATYALGHVAEQYYAQGRKLSTADLKALFARFQQEATTIYPRVQQQIQNQAGGLDLQKVLAMVQGR